MRVPASECDHEDDVNPRNVGQPVEDNDSDEDESDSEETRQLVEQGFEVCRYDHADGEQSGGIHGRRCALCELDTNVDPRCSCEKVFQPVRPDYTGVVALQKPCNIGSSILTTEPGGLQAVCWQLRWWQAGMEAGSLAGDSAACSLEAGWGWQLGCWWQWKLGSAGSLDFHGIQTSVVFGLIFYGFHRFQSVLRRFVWIS